MENKKMKPEENKEEHKHSNDVEKKAIQKDSTHEHKHEEKKNEEQVKKKEIVVEKPKVKKELALARAPSVHMSKRHGMYICSFIKGKKIDKAISELEEVIILKRAVPFKGEIPHRKGNMMSGRYPVAAAKIFIPMLKNLKGAVLFNNMDITKTRISSAYANFAPRPQRRGGMKGKRAYITIEARESEK